MKLLLFLTLLSLSLLNQLTFVSGNQNDPNAPAYTTLLNKLSKKTKNKDLLDSFKSVIKIQKDVLSTAESSEWLDVDFNNGQPVMNEIRNSNSRPKDWVNLMTNHIGNVEFVLKKMLGPAKDDIRKETNAEIDHLVSERSLIDKYTNKVYKFVITEPKIKDINGFEGALAQFDGKKIDAKHLKKIGNHLTSMQNTYNQVINKLTDKVPAAVTIRNEYLRIAAVQNIRQCGSLNSLRYVVSSLLQKQDALKTVLNEICTILNDYDNQRVKLAATITDFPIQSFIKN